LFINDGLEAESRRRLTMAGWDSDSEKVMRLFFLVWKMCNFFTCVLFTSLTKSGIGFFRWGLASGAE